MATKSRQKPISKSAIEKNKPFSIIKMVWLGEHWAVVVECFIKTVSYETVQRAFRKKFKLKRRESVLLRVTISKWVKTFRETSAAISIGTIGKKRSVQTAENCEKLRAAVQAAPWPHFVDMLLYVSRSIRHIKC